MEPLTFDIRLTPPKKTDIHKRRCYLLQQSEVQQKKLVSLKWKLALGIVASTVLITELLFRAVPGDGGTALICLILFPLVWLTTWFEEPSEPWKLTILLGFFAWFVPSAGLFLLHAHQDAGIISIATIAAAFEQLYFANRVSYKPFAALATELREYIVLDATNYPSHCREFLSMCQSLEQVRRYQNELVADGRYPLVADFNAAIHYRDIVYPLQQAMVAEATLLNPVANIDPQPAAAESLC